MPRSRVFAASIHTDGKPDAIDRAIDTAHALAAQAASSPLADTSEVEINLVTGTNHVSHALGHPPRGVLVTPKSASAAFAWGFDWTQPGNPHPDRVADLAVVGGPMTARLIFF